MMRSIELLACQLDDAFARQLERWAQDAGVWFRGLATPKPVLGLLRQGSRGILVLRLGRDLVRELELLQSVADGFPEVTIGVVGESDHPELEGLCYDLGAAYVAFGGEAASRVLEWLPRVIPAKPAPA
jgi:hypothetical protein